MVEEHWGEKAAKDVRYECSDRAEMICSVLKAVEMKRTWRKEQGRCDYAQCAEGVRLTKPSDVASDEAALIRQTGQDVGVVLAGCV
jgi:hypothetical protein